MKPHAFVPGNWLATCVHAEATAGGESVTLCGRVAAAPIHNHAPELPGEHDLAAVLPAPQSSPAPAHADLRPRAATHGAASAGAELGCVPNQCTEEGANRDASAGPEPCVPVLPAGSGLVARDSSGSSATPGSQSAVVTLQDDDLSESGVQRRARRQQEVAPDHATGAEGAGPELSAGPAPEVWPPG